MPYSQAVVGWPIAVVSAASSVLVRLNAFLPNLIGSLLVFLVGLALARLGKGLAVKILETLRLSKLLAKTGVSTFLRKAEVTAKVEEVVGEIVRWLIVFVFFIASVNLLGLTTVSSVLNSILAYIPSVISASLVLVVGVILAGVVERLIKGAVGAADVKVGRMIGKIASYTVVVFAVLAAISELKIAQSFINTLFLGVVGTFSLGFGLSLGLGTKDVVAKAAGEWYERFKRETR